MSASSPSFTSESTPPLAKAARLNLWPNTVASTRASDHREYARRPVHCDVWLIDAASQCVLRCKTDDVSDAGLHVTAPLGYGLAVGQRFETRIAGVPVAAPGPTHLGSSLGYATVIRTEIKVGERHSDRVCCALQFDAPQLIPV